MSGAAPIPKLDPSISGTAGVPAYNGFRDGARFVALTYDDGPDPEIAPRLLRLLAEESVRATFFLQGNRLKGSESLVRDLRDAGMWIGNHSWSHPHFGTLAEAEVRDEVRRTHDALGEILGEVPKLFRAPYNEVTESLFHCLGELGYAGYSSFEIFPDEEWVLPEGEDWGEDTIRKLKTTLGRSDAPFVDGHWDLRGRWLLLHDGWGAADRVLKATKWLIDEVRAHANGFAAAGPDPLR